MEGYKGTRVGMGGYKGRNGRVQGYKGRDGRVQGYKGRDGSACRCIAIPQNGGASADKQPTVDLNGF